MGKVLFDGLGEAVALDVETTGFSHDYDRIVSVALVKVDFPKWMRTGRLNYEKVVALVNPRRSIPTYATKVHGIRNEDVKGKPTFGNEAEKLRDFIGPLPIIGHNVQFDKRFLSAEFRRAKVKTLHRNRYYDTQERFVIDRGGRRKHSSLDDMVDALNLKGRSSKHHDALEDTMIVVHAAAHYYKLDQRSSGG